MSDTPVRGKILPFRTREARVLGYAEARLILRDSVIREALAYLNRNTYEGMAEARRLLERAIATMGDP